MIKSELIEQLHKKQSYLNQRDVEQVVHCLIESMIHELASGGRVEIRGFGSFSLVERLPMMGRNPRTGEPVALSNRYSVKFKAGLELAKRVMDSAKDYKIKQ